MQISDCGAVNSIEFIFKPVSSLTAGGAAVKLIEICHY